MEITVSWPELSASERDILLALQSTEPGACGVEVHAQLASDLSKRQCERRLETLAERDLVEKSRPPMDLRKNRYRLTADGQRVLEEQAERMIDAVGWDVLQVSRDADPVPDGGWYVSEHAAERWDERTAPDSVAPETAWMSSERRTDIEGTHGFDEARLHRPTGVVLGRCRAAIVTCFEPQPSVVDEIEVEA